MSQSVQSSVAMLARLSATTALAIFAGLAEAQVRTITRVVETGQTLASSGLPNSNQPISTINNFISTDVEGSPAFIGVLEDGTNFVWSGINAVFTTPMGLPQVLGTFEASTLGNAPGKWAISSVIAGNDTVYTNTGVLISEQDAAPGLAGKFIANASRPLMSGFGTTSWIGSLRNTPTGANLADRAFYVCTDGTLATAQPRFYGGLAFDGVLITNTPAQGIFFDYQISNSGRSINRLRVSPDGNAATPNIEVVAVSSATSRSVVLRAGTTILVAPQAGGGDFSIPVLSPNGNPNTSFAAMSTNDSGVTLISAFGGTNDYAAVKDGVVVARTNNNCAGVPLFALSSTDRLQALGVTPDGAGVLMWRYFDNTFNGGASRTSIFASRVGDFTDATVALSEGDQLDWTGDGTADGVLVSLPAPTHRNLDLANDGNIALLARVSNIGGGNERSMVIIASLGFVTDPGCDSIDFNGDGLFPDDNDLVDFLNVLAGGTCSNAPNCNDIDFNNDELFPDDSDLIVFLRVLAGGPCVE